MPASSEDLFAKLDALGIGHRTVTHPPLHTVEESRHLRGELPGLHVKNLFLKDKKGRMALVTCLEDRAVDLKALGPEVGLQRPSFGKPDLLWEVLGVRPGAVTPFALINDPGHAVTFGIDAALEGADIVNAHPLHNEATTAVSGADLMRFVADCGHAPVRLGFG